MAQLSNVFRLRCKLFWTWQRFKHFIFQFISIPVLKKWLFHVWYIMMLSRQPALVNCMLCYI